MVHKSLSLGQSFEHIAYNGAAFFFWSHPYTWSTTVCTFPRAESPTTSQVNDTDEALSLLTCNDGFYLVLVNGTGLCRPECLEWEEFPHTAVVAIDVFVILQAVVYVLAATAMVILSCIRYKKM